MPAKSASSLSPEEGPAIWMETADHAQTASFANTRHARAFRAEQKRLIEMGKYAEAIQMDIDDIRQLFGNKYDDAIEQMLEYARNMGLM